MYKIKEEFKNVSKTPWKGSDHLSSLSKDYEFAIETGCNDISDTKMLCMQSQRN